MPLPFDGPRARPTLTALLISATLTLGACSNDDDDGASGPDMPGNTLAPDDTPDGTTENTPDDTPDDTPDNTDDPDTAGDPLGNGPDGAALAFVSSAAFDFTAGQIERLDLGNEFASTGTTPATGSDIRVATDGTDVYEIGRFNLDTLTRFATDDLDDPVYQYSVNGEESTVNPYSIVFLNENKAYVIRRNSPLLWVVDPSSDTEANFLLSTIDLGAYDGDAKPEMSDAVIVDDKLFVLMERLDDDFAPRQNGYVAVIDTDTDTEIDTGEGQDGLFGIALQTSNPAGLQYLEESDEIYVVGRGNIFGNEAVEADPYNGGIETIDPDTYRNDLLLDDGTTDDNDDFFVDALVISPTRGYVLTYAGFRVTTLRTFNPMTGMLDEAPVEGLVDQDISVLALGPQERLWVGINGAADSGAGSGFRLLDPSDGSVLVERVATEFNPNGIVFIEPSGTTAQARNVTTR